ncbi:MAG: DNA polymerase III subunit beta [Thermomicrobium sp.]|nr:DNA polymerase III subunit beta [Thermomicrobium sp.]MDW7981688.1 DNA polymerase III subunit beta [Thermomicrobium sp.]
MQLRCHQAELERALHQVSRAVARRSTLPILSNLLLVAADNTLRVTATNLEIALSVVCPAEVLEPGQLSVRADVFSEFVGSLPRQDLTLVASPGQTDLRVTCGTSKARIPGLPAEDFPTIARIGEQPPTATIGTEDLREAVSQVVFAAATDDSRPVLAGVLLEFRGQELTFAAADGFRLSVRTVSLAQPPAADLAVIVPAKALGELARVLSDGDETVALLVTPNRSQLLARSGRFEFLSRLIDGSFPEFRQIIPKQWRTRVTVDRETFLAAARRAKIFAQSNNEVVKLQFVPGDSELDPGSLIVSAQAADAGETEDVLPARVDGPEATIAFNGRYLTDILSVVKATEIAIEMTSPNAAGVFRPVSDESFVHVVMPMVIGTA